MDAGRLCYLVILPAHQMQTILVKLVCKLSRKAHVTGGCRQLSRSNLWTSPLPCQADDALLKVGATSYFNGAFQINALSVVLNGWMEALPCSKYSPQL
jgi:hypothetical protein